MSSFFLFRYSAVIDEGHDIDRLIVFAAGRNFDQAKFEDAVVKEVTARLAPDELIILSRNTVADKVTQMAQQPSFRRIEARLGRQNPTVTVIGYNHEGQECQRKLLLGTGQPSNVVLTDIWRRGGTEIFRRRGGFVESTNAFHFANPSGKHTDRFIRLSNILVTHDEIEFVASASLLLIDHETEHFYIDTPALFTLFAAINDIRFTEGNLPPISCDSFRSYDGIATQNFDHTNAGVLISASSSGSLARLVSKRGFGDDRVAHILYLGADAKKARCAIDLGWSENDNPLGYPVNRVEHHSGFCKLCSNGSQPIALRGDQFDIAGPQPLPLLLNQASTPTSLHSVVDIHAGQDVFNVGGRDLPPCRLEASKLFGSTAGKEWRDYILNLNVPGSAAAVISVDATSKQLAEEIAGRVNCVVEDLSAFEKRIPPDGNFCQPIVVVQTIIGSGRQIIDVSRDLRRWPSSPIVYIVGFAATESMAKLKALRSNLEKTWNVANHRLVIINQLVLPQKGESNAWEAEAKLIDRGIEIGAIETPTIIARRDKLASLADGFSKDIFLPNAADKALKLSAGFVFWPVGIPERPGISQADVFITISSVLQTLRSGEGNKPSSTLRSAWFYSTILSPENFGRFNDGVIQASLLRAARPSEIDYRDNPEQSREAKRLIARIIQNPDKAKGDAAREFALALATKRLRLQHEHQDELLTVRTNDAVLNELLELAKNDVLRMPK